jgi:hypothetical protein
VLLLADELALDPFEWVFLPSPLPSPPPEPPISWSWWWEGPSWRCAVAELCPWSLPLLCVSAASAGDDRASKSISPHKKIANDTTTWRRSRGARAMDPTNESSKMTTSGAE